MTNEPKTEAKKACPDFAGIEWRRASDEQIERARRHTLRAHRERRLAEKLDALLGAVDGDDE